MKNIALLFALLCVAPDCHAAPAHRCAADAVKQARKLLVFHFGTDERMDVDKTAKALAPLRNPAGKGSFDVLEVGATIYKGTYRMRLIYGQVPGECVLVGQEVLEITNL